MTLLPDRPDDHIPRIPDKQRILGSYEVQLRNLNGVKRHARPIVERLEGQRGLTEQAALLLDHIDTCNPDNWITAVSALRVVMERERR
jgi:hypothetical protein